MNYKYVMHEGAINDLAEAYIWYETQREGLGEEFLSAIREVSMLISLNPQAFQKDQNGDIEKLQ